MDPKERATLQEVMNSKWVNEGYDGPPKNYLPERPVITSVERLSKDLVNRILAFGYTLEDVNSAFSPEADHSKPNPIRATYFLLQEMIQREEARIKSEKRAASVRSIEINNSSLGTINENTASISTERLHSRHISKNKPWGSVNTIVQSAFAPRRSSTPDAFKRNEVAGSMPLPSPTTANTYDTVRIPDALQNQKRATKTDRAPFVGAGRKSSLGAYEMKAEQRRKSSGTFNVDRRPSSSQIGGKVKEELRAVSGWFLNVSTTSSKPPREIVAEIVRVLKLNNVTHRIDEGSFTVVCQVDVSTFSGESGGASPGDDSEEDEESTPISPTRGGKSDLGFQIEVCKVRWYYD